MLIKPNRSEIGTANKKEIAEKMRAAEHAGDDATHAIMRDTYVGPGRAIGRYFAKFLSGLVIGLGYFWMLWDPKKQTWHDKLVNTVVVKA